MEGSSNIQPYRTPYVGVNIADGRFVSLRLDIRDIHHQHGYWLFEPTSVADACALGIRDPEAVIRAVWKKYNGTSLDGLILRWIPSRSDTFQAPRSGNVKAHFFSIAGERRELGQSGLCGSYDLPTYPNDEDGRLLQYRRDQFATQAAKSLRPSLNVSASRPTTGKDGHGFNMPTDSRRTLESTPSAEAAGPTTLVPKSNRDHHPSRQGLVKLPQSLPVSTEDSPMTSTTLPFLLERENNREQPSPFEVRRETTSPDLEGTRLRTLLLNLEGPMVSYNSLPHSPKNQLESPASAPQSIKFIPTENLPEFSSRCLPIPECANSPTPASSHSQMKGNLQDTETNTQERINIMGELSADVHYNESGIISPAPAEDTISSQIMTNASEMNLNRQNERIPPVPAPNTPSALARENWPYSAIPNSTEFPAMLGSPQRESEIENQLLNAFVPCMDCGKLLGHTIECHIGSLKLVEKPNALELRRIADQVERLDPEQWREHRDPPPKEREDHATVIAGIIELIRNDDSYKSDECLHSLTDEALVIAWGLRQCKSTKAEFVFFDGDRPYVLGTPPDEEPEDHERSKEGMEN
ncbi:hypothetical protein BU24DRAFT_464869 [Aaosphaeria arxii CBS 175.79]|uniref:Uncharacterized protein n=1 Tax=Aaosphaeria arxii CBS 175.79 TaxID=1450172 RepID=A0A6A5XHM7_9PLEO|nr:uncharacterized protein BU24DRAFT_464869 [Aaosphaeria arxii CBS 175.79]KAF2012473.1 hypothetical protein BU24DRAFT_464869 [Aaosphaeria arxii CBS 175.79]